MSDMEVLRRIAERGLKKAQREQSSYVDLFQHMLDEIHAVTRNKDRCPRCGALGLHFCSGKPWDDEHEKFKKYPYRSDLEVQD